MNNNFSKVTNVPQSQRACNQYFFQLDDIKFLVSRYQYFVDVFQDLMEGLIMFYHF